MTTFSARDLARLALDGRRNPHRRRVLPQTTRVTVLDLMIRIGRRATEAELRAALEELAERGAVTRGEGGWAVLDWDVLAECAA